VYYRGVFANFRCISFEGIESLQNLHIYFKVLKLDNACEFGQESTHRPPEVAAVTCTFQNYIKACSLSTRDLVIVSKILLLSYSSMFSTVTHLLIYHTTNIQAFFSYSQ